MKCLALTILGLSTLHQATAIKMNGVKAQSGSLSTTQHTELSCDYLKWKQEELVSVNWAVQYPGLKTDFLQYKNDGSKRTPTNDILGVDLGSVDEKTVSVMVSETFPEERLTICCEVTFLRDSGYGSMAKKMKEKCSPFTVEREPVQPLQLNLRMSHTEAAPEDLVDIYCSSEDLQLPQPDFAILVNGRDLPGERRGDTLAARLALTVSHFLERRGRPAILTVECQASQGGRLLANITKTIRKVEQQQVEPQQVEYQQARRQPRYQASSYSHILLETRHSSGAIIVGQVSADIMENLHNPRSSGLRLETSEEPIEILRILGYFGYNVMAMANTPDNRIIWTLTRKNVN